MHSLESSERNYKMTGTIFDLIEKEPSEGKEGFFDIAKKAPQPKDNSYFSTVSDYAKTFIKGASEGALRLGRIMGPSDQRPNEELFKQQEEAFNELLPVEEDFGQRALRRGLREAPTAVALPGSTITALPKSIAAGFAGEGAKDLGAPEWAQTALELTTFAGPDLTKKLISSGKNKDIIDFGKKMGFTDEQIAPLLNSEFKQKWLSKIVPKRGSTQQKLANTKAQLDNTYGTLAKGENAAIELSEKDNGNLINGLFEKLNEMPREVRGKIEKDLNDLLNNKITGRSLINFYADINSELGGSTKQLSLLKDPIKKALSSISPDLAGDFELVNKMYTKFHPIAARLKPNLTSDIISAAETLGVLGTITMGYYPPLISIVGEHAARKIGQHLLLNPRLQQLSKKIVRSLNENKFTMTQRLLGLYSKEVKKVSPEMSTALKDLSEEDLKKYFNQ